MSKDISPVEKIFLSSKGLYDFQGSYLELMKLSLEEAKLIDLSSLYEELLNCRNRGGKVIAFGNGGSAANAAHFCTGISYVTRNWENPIKSICLNQDTVLLTSLANDHGYENVFVKQLQVLAQPNDLIVCFSVSGQSSNVVKAMDYAKNKEIKTCAFLGSSGGKVLPLSDVLVHVSSPHTVLGFTEDVHMILCHLLAYYLEYTHSNKKTEKALRSEISEAKIN